MIANKMSQQERLIRLNESAKRQMKVLKNNKSIKDLEVLQKEINNDDMLLIETKWNIKGPQISAFEKIIGVKYEYR